MSTEDKYMTVEEVAQYLGFEKQTIYNKVHTNAIPFHKIGLKAVRFKKAEVDAWIERQKTSVREFVKKGDKFFIKLAHPLQEYDITTEEAFLAAVMKEFSGIISVERLPFQIEKQDMKAAKALLKQGFVYPRTLKENQHVYELGGGYTAFYLTLRRLLKDKLPSSVSEEELFTHLTHIRKRIAENIRDNFPVPDADIIKVAGGDAYLGYRAEDYVSGLLEEFTRIAIYLGYGRRESAPPRIRFQAYANRYFDALTFLALYIGGFCYFVQDPASEIGTFLLKDKLIVALSPDKIEDGLKHNIFTFDEIKADLTARISDIEAEATALKAIVKHSAKGGRRGRKD